MSVDDLHHPPSGAVGCAILTISDTRTPETDTAGRAIRDLLSGAGHTVVERGLIPDEPAEIVAMIAAWTTHPDIRVIITTGGTGIARRDASVDAIAALFNTELPGFGELFRHLSFEEIGPAAMLSRATAGIIDRTAVFVLPGSEHAVRLAMTALVIPQLGHLARELTK